MTRLADDAHAAPRTITSRSGHVWTSWDDISGVYLLSWRHPDPERVASRPPSAPAVGVTWRAAVWRTRRGFRPEAGCTTDAPLRRRATTGTGAYFRRAEGALNCPTHGASRPSPPFPRLLGLCRCGVGAAPSSRYASQGQLADVVRDVGGAGELLAVGV